MNANDSVNYQKQLQANHEILLGVLTANFVEYPTNVIENLVSLHSAEELQTIATGFENVMLAMAQSDNPVLLSFAAQADSVAGVYWRACRLAVESECADPVPVATNL